VRGNPSDVIVWEIGALLRGGPKSKPLYLLLNNSIQIGYILKSYLTVKKH